MKLNPFLIFLTGRRKDSTQKLSIDEFRNIAKIDGKTIAFEYDIGRSNPVDQLAKKKEVALGKYDIVRFVCSSVDARLIEKAV
jgi:hypothetical protein